MGLYSIACLLTLVHLSVHVETAMENKGKSVETPPCGEKVDITSHLLCAVCVSVCHCIQLFTMLPLCIE